MPQYSNPADHFLEILQIDRTPSTLASSAHSSSSTSKEKVHSQFSSVAFSEGVKGDGMFRGDIKLQEFADMSTHESSSLPNMFAECWERFAEEKMTKEGQGQRSHSKMLAFPSGNGEREEEEEVEHQGFHLSVFDQTCILIQRNFQIVLQDKSQFLVHIYICTFPVCT